MGLVLGVGCDRGTSLLTLETAVEQALAIEALDMKVVTRLATIDKKADELAILQLSRQRQWPIQFYTAEQLAKIEVPSPSDVVMKYMGTPSVAEAAALIAANQDMSALLVEKFKYRGEDGKNATVSMAWEKNL